jgi:predicted TIM-barrel fold metal-dependent hydrolase
MSNVIIVSSDGHAVMPPSLWSDYLEKRYHEHLPRLREETDVFTRSMKLLNDLRLSPEACEVFDREHAYRSGRWKGLWDADVRLAEMDREGVAAELVYTGDFRASDLFHSTMNGTYPLDAVDAGVRAFDRWAGDTFGAASDRFLLVGAMGPCVDMDAALAEATWVADQGFVGTFAPGWNTWPGQRPLYDEHWERLWSLYEECGLALIVHGGYGFDQGSAFGAIEAAHAQVEAAHGTDADLVVALASGVFNSEFFSDLRCRRAMWQLMLSGVFDRHPDLKLMLTEVRADWIPATLRRLDEVYLDNRADLPAKRLPSEYWHSNCLAGLSFMHKAEVEMRDEIGVETIAFGRDYPHTEGTWPNTLDYLRDLFAGVPEDDVRRIAGENAIRFLSIDEAKLAGVAAAVGPTIEDLTAGTELAPELLAHIDDRCGYLKPPEGGARLAEIDGILHDDAARVGARASS